MENGWCAAQGEGEQARRPAYKQRELYGQGDDNDLLQKFMFKGKGGRFKNQSRRLFHSILGFLAPCNFRPVMTMLLKFAGVKNLNKHIPSRKCLAKMLTEMKNVSSLHVASKISGKTNVTIYHDASTLGQGTASCNHHLASQLGIDGEKEGDEPQVFTLGSLPTATGESVDGVRAVLAQFANLKTLVEMVERGATEGDIQMSSSLMAVADSINIAMIKAVMHDHAVGEDKLIDLLEEEIVKWKKLNISGFTDLSEDEQDNLSLIVRGYC